MLGLATWLRLRAERDAARLALTYENSTFTYAALQSEIEGFARFLEAQNVVRGDRVAYLGMNHSSFVVALFGTARLGAVFVPLNFRSAGPELTFVIDDCGASALIGEESFLGILDGIETNPDLKVRISLGEFERDGWTAYDSKRKYPEDSEVAVDPDSPGIILYTSGTTGQPKGVVLTHRNLFTNNVNWMLSVNYHRDHTALTSAPLFHSGGLCVMLLPLLMAGGHVVLHRQFDPDRTLHDVARYQVTALFLVPTMMLYLTQAPLFAEADMSSIEFVVAGAAPVPERLLQIFGERGIAVSQCWGLTETSTGATFLSPKWALDKLGSCGTPGILNEVKLIRFDGAPLEETNVAGELCVRGGIVTPGYWNRADATAEAQLPGGWFRTGDVAYRDEDGFYFICDRLKDMVITGGENVYPAEVESVIYDHPDVADVAVIGAPDEEWGERVVAVVVPRQGATIELEVLREFVAARLARYKLPRELRLVPELPRNTTGKIMKQSLRVR
jgi:fatty-acyl-CoA synthase